MGGIPGDKGLLAPLLHLVQVVLGSYSQAFADTSRPLCAACDVELGSHGGLRRHGLRRLKPNECQPLALTQLQRASIAKSWRLTEHPSGGTLSRSHAVISLPLSLASAHVHVMWVAVFRALGLVCPAVHYGPGRKIRNRALI